jgi:hypothetical protein
VDTERVLSVGERGIHLLFETGMITEAFTQDADVLRRAVDGRLEEIHAALRRLSQLPDAQAGRRFVASLAPPVRHVLVLLYFELLDGRLRRRPVLH